MNQKQMKPRTSLSLPKSAQKIYLFTNNIDIRLSKNYKKKNFLEAISSTIPGNFIFNILYEIICGLERCSCRELWSLLLTTHESAGYVTSSYIWRWPTTSHQRLSIIFIRKLPRVRTKTIFR